MAKKDKCIAKYRRAKYYPTLFLLSWSSRENQSEERYATGWGVWHEPTVFVCSSAAFGLVTRYSPELTSVAKYILQPSEVVQARSAMIKLYNVTTLNCPDTTVSYRCQAANWRLRLKAVSTPLLWLAVVCPREGQASWERKRGIVLVEAYEGSQKLKQLQNRHSAIGQSYFSI
jgi:hypothetical protein